MEDGPNHLRLSIQQDPQAAEVMRELGHRMHTRISESTHTHAHNSLKFGISIPIFEHVFKVNWLNVFSAFSRGPTPPKCPKNA
jgi:hypothetical protein